MGRQERNELFARTSFLDGANADYIEELHAKYQNNPGAVDEEWQSFFRDLKDAPDDVLREAEGPSWKRDGWPIAANGELVSALDGDWAPVEQQLGAAIQGRAQTMGVELTSDLALAATRDSVRALMMIRLRIGSKSTPLTWFRMPPVTDGGKLMSIRPGFSETTP